jgi:hypothetical protein
MCSVGTLHAQRIFLACKAIYSALLKLGKLKEHTKITEQQKRDV